MSALTALDALLRAMPAICHVLGDIDERWQDKAFDRLCDAALADAAAKQPGNPADTVTWTPTSGGSALDQTALMEAVRHGQDPLTYGR